MGRVSLFIFFLCFCSSVLAGFEKAEVNQREWLIYEVNQAHSLDRFVKDLKIPKKYYKRFKALILRDNTRLSDDDLIYPGEKILLRKKLLNHLVKRKKMVFKKQ